MVKVGKQGLDDRYIPLRSHRISHPVGLRLRQSHLIMFLRPGFRPSFHVWFWSTKKLWKKTKTNHSQQTILQQNFHLIDFRNRIGFSAAQLTRLVLQRAICSRINHFRLALFRCCTGIRAAAMSIPGFAHQEQGNKT